MSTMTKLPKLPIQSILNPSPPLRPRTPHSPHSGSELSSPASDFNDLSTPSAKGNAPPRVKRSRDSSDLTYMKPQAPIKYPPFEVLDEVAYNRMAKFNVYPFGQIGQHCAHIPYSSDKKDVFEKTGREGFYLFVYRFTNPTDDKVYDIMWDYQGGYVRISPFFKSRKHKKTGPAKMLELNTGLREISWHMTGGNRIAQGYWLPYDCARAVCITFCHPIAGALIPLFGPTFPDECIPPESPSFGRMQINSDIIQQAKFDCTAWRHAGNLNGNLNLNLNMGQRPGGVTSHPRSDYRAFPPLGQIPSPQPRPHPNFHPHYPYSNPVVSHTWRPIESIPDHTPAPPNHHPPPAPPPPAPNHTWGVHVGRSKPNTSSPIPRPFWNHHPSSTETYDADPNVHPIFRENAAPSLQLEEPPPSKRRRMDVEGTSRHDLPAETRASTPPKALSPEPKLSMPVEAQTERGHSRHSPHLTKPRPKRKHSSIQFDSDEIGVAFSLVALSKSYRLRNSETEYHGDMLRSNSC